MLNAHYIPQQARVYQFKVLSNIASDPSFVTEFLVVEGWGPDHITGWRVGQDDKPYTEVDLRQFSLDLKCNELGIGEQLKPMLLNCQRSFDR